MIFLFNIKEPVAWIIGACIVEEVFAVILSHVIFATVISVDPSNEVPPEPDALIVFVFASIE